MKRKLSTLAGKACRAKPPPFSNSTLDLTRFMSWIVAPCLDISLVNTDISSMLTGGLGIGNREEPPPMMYTRMTRGFLYIMSHLITGYSSTFLRNIELFYKKLESSSFSFKRYNL